MKKQCNKDDSLSASGTCNTISGSSIANAIKEKLVPGIVDQLGSLGPNFEDSDILLRNFLYFEQEQESKVTLGISSQENCNDWSIDSNSTETPKSSSSTSVSTSYTTCDPNRNTFECTREYCDKEQTFNSSILLACVLFSFTCILMTVGKNYKIQFRCTTVVRTGCFLATVLMAFLVYIGSTHLHDAALCQGTQGVYVCRYAQEVWRAVYLLVSFLCFSGGMMVLPAPEAKNEVIVTNDDNTTVATSDVELQLPATTAAESELCCSCCSCCNVFILKSIYALKAAKAQFWDGEDTFSFLFFAFLFFI